MRSIDRSHAFVALVTAIVVLVAPAAAREVVDFARNAGKVDGFDAVGAQVTDRARKLVATNRSGQLPNNIIRQAPDSARLAGVGPSAFIRRCELGGIRGEAHVTPEVGTTFEAVQGFSSAQGGPLDEDATNCHFHQAEARHVSAGVFDVFLGAILWTCSEPLPPGIILANLSIESATPLIGTYEPTCENNHVNVRVHITNIQGVPADAPFTVLLIDAHGIPIP